MGNLKLATVDYIDDILSLCLSFHKESPYSEHSFSVDKVQRIVLELMQTGLVLMTMQGDIPVGVLLAFTYQGPFSEELWATELAWYISPEHRGFSRANDMLGAYEYWARLKGCKAATLVSMGRVDKMYERKGFQKRETAYFKEL